jgi:hypothetical protein
VLRFLIREQKLDVDTVHHKPASRASESTKSRRYHAE